MAGGLGALTACQHVEPEASGTDEVEAVRAGMLQPGAAPEPTRREAAPGDKALEERRLWNPRPAQEGGAAAPIANMSLAEAVTQAALTFPEVRIQEQRLREARAGIDVSGSQLYPSLEARVASGASFTGNYAGSALPYSRAANQPDGRLDTSFALRQLLFDFGATGQDIRRAEFIREAEREKLRDKIDDTSYRVAQLVLRLGELRAIVALLDDTVAAHRKLLQVVKAQADEGHGTMADVNRVQSRLVDIATIRSDTQLQVKAAEDNFARLTGFKPGRIGAMPDLRAALPRDPAGAIARADISNPRLASLDATRKSAEAELEFQKRSVLPRFNVELDKESKNLREGSDGRSQLDARAMLAMRVRLLDGGLARATEKQIEARITGAEATIANERRLVETDLRQAYRTIETAPQKRRLIEDGVRAAAKVKELYLEQFQGGRRTVFELLDGQMSYYTARRSQIETMNEGVRATLDILKVTGELTRAIINAGAHPGTARPGLGRKAAIQPGGLAKD